MSSAAPTAVRETLRFETLADKLLLRNGNYLYRIPYRDRQAVLKVYYGSRSFWRYVTGTCGNLLFAGQTSFMPKARRRTELDCIALWRAHGFRVFDVYDVEVIAPGVPLGGYAVYEYVPGRRFADLLPDPAVPEEEKRALYRRFLGEWHRRHELALRTCDPRLIHENGDLKHVMLWQDELVWFDFEMCFRSRRRMMEFVAREILAYLKSLGKVLGPERFASYLEETVRHYPARELLEYTHTYIARNPNPLRRAGRWLDYRVKSRPKKPFSKHNVARRLRQLLDR
ncbi:MAG: hypothetical protein JXQ29_04410 [Planctomycetes bacterium]|nr:hypothetical protein [Planctomycetota bacterium]